MKASGLTDPDSLAKIGNTEEYQQYIASEGAVPLLAEWALKEPIQAADVPASAVVTHGSKSCVSVEGAAVNVEVVSSSLGHSQITFPREVPKQVDIIAPEDLACQ